jgi:hypothetical protein
LWSSFVEVEERHGALLYREAWRFLVEGGGRWGPFVEEGGRQELCCRGRKKGRRSLVKGDGRRKLCCRVRWQAGAIL